MARRQKFLAALEARIKPATTAFKTADAEVEAAQTDIDGRTAAVEPFQAVMAPYLAEKFRRAREDIKSYVKDTEVLQAGTKTIVISDYKPQPIQHPQMDPHLTSVPPARVGAAQSSIAVAKTAAMAAVRAHVAQRRRRRRGQARTAGFGQCGPCDQYRRQIRCWHRAGGQSVPDQVGAGRGRRGRQGDAGQARVVGRAQLERS